MTTTSSNTELPGYCCQTCGECIGYVGRFFQKVPGMGFLHTCQFKAEEVVVDYEDENTMLPEEVAAEEEMLAEREEIARWHDREAKRWEAELWDRRSWGGPTMGAEECEVAIRMHKKCATAIRNGEYYASDTPTA